MKNKLISIYNIAHLISGIALISISSFAQVANLFTVLWTGEYLLPEYIINLLFAGIALSLFSYLQQHYLNKKKLAVSKKQIEDHLII